MHVLFVAYRFPPQSGGGVIRPLKFAKYLSRMGVRVTVLTATPPPDIRQDPSLLQDLPSDVRVVTVREEPAIPTRSRENAWKRVQVARRWAWYHTTIPDERAGFIVPATHAAFRLGRTEFDVVLATGGPWSAFVAGEKISEQLNLPLVLDYRDPWTTVFSGVPRDGGFLARWRNPMLERRIVSHARAIVSVHKSVPAIMEIGLGLPGLAARCQWIPNGFDPEDFDGLTPTPSTEFVISYVGSLYGTRTLRPVAEALCELVGSGEISQERLRIRVLGPDARRVMRDFAGLPIAGNVDAPGLVAHREALSALMSSTVNLLVDLVYGGPNVHTPGKLYEYLRAERPILALSAEGSTPDLIREAQGGWIVSPDDRAGLLEVLKRAYEDWKSGRQLPCPTGDVIARFDRARLTAELARILEACVADGNRSAARTHVKVDGRN